MAPPTPLDARDLEPCVAPLGHALTLPAAAHTSDVVFAWEQEHFFEGSWYCLGRAGGLVSPGGHRAFAIGRDAVLVTADREGTPSVFFDVCRHRGHQLVQPGTGGVSPVIKCPYHSWSYGHDGSLRGAPRFGDHPTFDRADHSLIPVRAHEWHGWLFVNASEDAEPFETHAGSLDRLTEAHEPERLVSLARHEYTVAANWKILTENYHECYHCSTIHPELCKVSSPESGTDSSVDGGWVGGSMDLFDHVETMSLTGKSNGIHLRGLDERARRQVYYYSLFPNLLISLHPDYVMTHLLEPLAPDSTRVTCEWLWPPEVLADAEFDPAYAVEFWDLTNRQDWEACEAVQKGAASRGYRQGPLSMAEGTTHSFISMVAASYLADRVVYPHEVQLPRASSQAQAGEAGSRT